MIAKADHPSEQRFWAKAKRSAKVAGRAVLSPALTLYYAFNDADTPAWAKTVIVGAVTYFVSPIDAIPDLVPALGYSDDLVVLAGALATVGAHIKTEHKERARKWLDDVLG